MAAASLGASIFGGKKSKAAPPAPQVPISQVPTLGGMNALSEMLAAADYQQSQALNTGADRIRADMMRRGMRTSGSHMRSLSDMYARAAEGAQATRQGMAGDIFGLGLQQKAQDDRLRMFNAQMLAGQQAQQAGIDAQNTGAWNQAMGGLGSLGGTLLSQKYFPAASTGSNYGGYKTGSGSIYDDSSMDFNIGNILD